MTRFRFSLVGLMGAVLVVAVVLAALRNASELWASVWSHVLLCTLVFAIVGVLSSRGQRRVFCCGFAVCGWTYSVIVFAPWFHDNVGDHLVTKKLLKYLYPKLRTLSLPTQVPGEISVFAGPNGSFWVNGKTVEASELTGHLEQLVSDNKANLRLRIYLDAMTQGNGSPTTRSVVAASRQAGMRMSSRHLLRVVPEKQHFDQLGHSLFTLLIALVGGGLAVLFFGERSEE